MSSVPAAPRILVGLDDRAADGTAADRSGALWRLDQPGRQLDANLVRLRPDAVVGEHVEHDLDVLLVVVEGDGYLDGSPSGRESLTPGALAWLPRSARRNLTAGPRGLAYLTVHRRRPALGIKGPGFTGALGGDGALGTGGAGGEGGEAPCMLDRVCTACGRVSAETAALYCSRCGEALPARDS
ncbi:hypothetical protein [Streptacidiphilus cavernicola]|uniref:Cupin 2 conserved barrel domain-containing protein n=1 Tax=Streptacidiphilus cavernicola TaxID=3342716 RepID=A0ABV6VZ57_9ACTN